MIEYSWQFPSVMVSPSVGDLNNVVVSVHWSMVAQHMGITASSYGTVELSSPSSDSFVELDNINDDIIQQWVQPLIADLDHIQQKLADEIDYHLEHPTMSVMLPYAGQSE